jgi:hypothetical protein
MSLRGHLWTIGGHVRRSVPRPQLPEALDRVDVSYASPQGRTAILSGFADLTLGSQELLVVLHGLGGSVTSSYIPTVLGAARAAGLDAVVLNGRGAARPDGSSDGELSHAGLDADIAALLAHPQLARYRQLYLLGYSMGGHLALRYACSSPEPRVKAVAALCAPLHLEKAMQAFDGSAFGGYRRFVLTSLKQSYVSACRAQPALRRRVPLGKLRKIREWDERVVAPYFGFQSIWAYYESQSVRGRLKDLSVRSLYLGAEADPMVSASSTEGALSGASSLLDVRFSSRGGHLAFPKEFSLGLPVRCGVEHQVIEWLRRAT